MLYPGYLMTRKDILVIDTLLKTRKTKIDPYCCPVQENQALTLLRCIFEKSDDRLTTNTENRYSRKSSQIKVHRMSWQLSSTYNYRILARITKDMNSSDSLPWIERSESETAGPNELVLVLGLTADKVLLALLRCLRGTCCRLCWLHSIQLVLKPRKFKIIERRRRNSVWLTFLTIMALAFSCTSLRFSAICLSMSSVLGSCTASLYSLSLTLQWDTVKFTENIRKVEKIAQNPRKMRGQQAAFENAVFIDRPLCTFSLLIAFEFLNFLRSQSICFSVLM